MTCRHATSLVSLFAILLSMTTAASGQSRTDTGDETDFDAHLRPLLTEYCVTCHNDRLRTADLTFEPFLSSEDAVENHTVWERVADRLRRGDMPPAGRPTPARESIAMATRWIDALLGRTEDAPPDPGRVTARRLNRVEYNNTVRSLLGVHSQPADDFPADDSGYGFDNNGDVLSVSPLLMERYIAAARRLSQEAVFGPSLPDAPIQLAHYMARRSHDAGGTLDNADTLPFSMRGALYGTHLFPWTAEYELRFRVANYRRRPPQPQRARTAPPNTPAELDQFMEEMRKAAPPVPVIASLDGRIFNETIVEGVNAFDYDRGEIVTRVPVEAGEHAFRISYPHVADIVDPRDNVGGDGRRILYIDYLDIVGPFNPRPEPPASHAQIFTCQPQPGKHSDACAGEIVTTLARRAYRRPPTPEERERLTRLVAQVQRNGDSFEEGIRVAIQAVLLSPHFLFRVEREHASANRAPYRISDHELATRLSYFLWADMPDAELFRLADEGTLSVPDILNSQVRRMLADPKAAALVTTFADQWLQLRKLDRSKPNPDRFPTVDDELRDAMRRETQLFIEAIIQEDRSVLDLIDAPFTFLNGPLAHHYGIEGVTGEHFRRVALTGEERSGLLTQASILTVSSYPTRTSPVLRGKWVLDNLLGAPPPDPPDGIPPLDEAAVGTTGSLRSQLEAHRTNPSCAVCHDQIDPLGFGLERYDATGAWRTHDGPFAIDDSGLLPDGTAFRGSRELKAVLKSQGRQFIGNVAEKLLTYALGRGLESYDSETIDAIVTQAATEEARFSSLVLGVVQSDAFLMRRGEEPTP